MWPSVFSSLRKLFSKVRIKQADDIKEASLLGLPTELLQLISCFLRPSKAIALTLSSKTLLFKTRQQNFQACVHDTSEKQHLLSLLDRDTGGFRIHCYPCRTIHHLATLCEEDRPGYLRPRPCVIKDYDVGYRFQVDRLFRSIHLQLVMKQYRLGLDTTYYLNYIDSRTRLSFEARNWEMWRIASYRNITARIIDSELMFRSQLWTFWPYPQKPVPRWVTYMLHNYEQCPHERFDEYKQPFSFLQNYIDVYNNWSNLLGKPSELHQCSYCETEYQLDPVDFGHGILAIVVTKWLNLGPCVSPKDPKWARHFHLKWYTLEIGTYSPIEYPLGCLKRKFEGSDHFDFTAEMSEEKMRKIVKAFHSDIKYEYWTDRLVL